MFEIEHEEPGVVRLIGRLDAARAPKAEEVFRAIDGPCTVDFGALSYISSAGLGVLLKTQKRLADAGHGLVLTNLSPHIRQVFRFAGFHHVFRIE